MTKMLFPPVAQHVAAETETQDLVLVNLCTDFPVFAPPTATLPEILDVVRKLDSAEMAGHAVIFHPVTLVPVRAKLDPFVLLKRGRAI